jgi:hypothetical protein
MNPGRPIRVLALSPMPQEGAGCRFRIAQFIPYLESVGFEVTLESLFTPEFFRLVYKPRNYLRKAATFAALSLKRLDALREVSRFDLVFLYRELFPLGPALIERMLAARQGPPIVLDFDDAIFLPNVSDANVYQDEFVSWAKGIAGGGPVMFSLDNEPDLWVSTHPEVHPEKATYDELVSRNIDFALAIKNVWPEAKVFGFVSYGWSGYTTLQGAPDADEKGDFVEYYLQKMKAAEAARAAGVPESLAKGSAVASDAFFPFADGLLAAAEAGATAIIQPGGSLRDGEVMDAADSAGLAMVFTGVRHFRH